MNIVFDSQLRAPNRFKREHWESLSKYGEIIGGRFILTTPNIDDFLDFCAENGYSVTLNRKIAERNKIAIVHYKNGTFYVSFGGKFAPPITTSTEWKKLAIRDPNTGKFTFQYFPLLLAIDLLSEYGYDVKYDKSAEFIVNDTYFNGIPPPRIIGNWHPMPHQIEGANKIFEWDGKGIIGDEAGLGKSITAVLAVMNLYEFMEFKRGIWVVPTIPLVFQAVEELRDRFGIQAFPITQKISRNKRLGINGKSIYEEFPFCVVTWATFRNDWTKNFNYVKHIKFGFAIFDEVHICSYGNKSYEAVLNFPAEYRIGLTGTPSPNGKWHELYDIIYAMNPLALDPITKYIEREKKLLKRFVKHPKGRENPEKTAERVMNKITNTQLSKKIIRHERSHLSSELPQIIEIEPIHVPLNGSEDLIVETLFEILESIIDEWIGDRKNFVIEYAKSMIWQDIRRFCAYGGKNFYKRIDMLLTEKTPVYDYIRKRYKQMLVQIDRELHRNPIIDYPKFPVLWNNLSKIPNHHVIVFCDSVMTAIDLGDYLSEMGADCKVITGQIDYGKLLENVPISARESEKDRIERIFKKLGQKGSMTDNEVQEILEWFWSPYMQVSGLSESFRVKYVIDGVDMEYCYYVTLKKAKKIQIHIDSRNLSKADKRRIREVFDLITEIDRNAKYSDEGKEITISFVNHERKTPKLLVTTNKLAEGCNLQIAQSVIFFDQPLSIKEKEQRLARIHRMGSPYDKVYLMSLICGIEYAILRTLKEKYESAESIGFSKAKSIGISEIVREMKRMKKGKKTKKLA